MDTAARENLPFVSSVSVADTDGKTAVEFRDRGGLVHDAPDEVVRDALEPVGRDVREVWATYPIWFAPDHEI